MKRTTLLLATVAGIGSLLLGAALLLVGLLFKQLGWQDAFRGSVSGLVVIGLSIIGWLVFALVSGFSPSSAVTGAQRLSSRLTLYVKLFVPYYLLAAWLVVSIESYFSFHRAAIFWPLTLAFGLMLSVVAYLSSHLYVVAETDGHYLIRGYTKCYRVPKAGGVKISNSRLLSWIVADSRRYFYIPAML